MHGQPHISTPSLTHAFRISTFLNFLELIHVLCDTRKSLWTSNLRWNVPPCKGIIWSLAQKNYTCGVEINP